MKTNLVPYPNCEIKESCYFVLCLMKYPNKRFVLKDQNRTLQVFDNEKLIATVPVKHPGRKECRYCNVYSTTLFKSIKRAN